MNRTKAVQRDGRDYIYEVVKSQQVEIAMKEYMDKAFAAKLIFTIKNKPSKTVSSAHLWAGNYSRMNRFDALAQETEGKIRMVNAYTYAEI